jgi:hypothetical protein
MGWIALVASPSVSYVSVAVPMTLSGAGFALAIPALTKTVVSSVALADIGKASGTFSTMRQLGGAFGVAILVAVFAASGGYATAQAFTDGFVPAIAVSAALALAGAVAGSLLPGENAPARAVAASAT